LSYRAGGWEYLEVSYHTTYTSLASLCAIFCAKKDGQRRHIEHFSQHTSTPFYLYKRRIRWSCPIFVNVFVTLRLKSRQSRRDRLDGIVCHVETSVTCLYTNGLYSELPCIKPYAHNSVICPTGCFFCKISPAVFVALSLNNLGS